MRARRAMPVKRDGAASLLGKGITCKKPIKQLTAKWTDPFKCKMQGTYELDTIKPGTGLKETSSYLYKPNIHICAAPCENVYVGLNVGP